MERFKWVKARASNPSGNCVQAMFDGVTVYVRDSKNPEADVLAYSRPEWDAFTAGVKAGDFDL